MVASPSGRAVKGIGLRPLDCWDCGFESHQDICCECCVLSGRGLCDELITRPGESYQLWCVIMCDLEEKNLVNEEAKAHWGGLSRQEKNKTNGYDLF